MSQCELDELSMPFKITNDKIQVPIPSLLFTFSDCWLRPPSIRHLASPISGTLKVDGTPVEGVKIYRSASSAWYKNLEKEEVTQSSKDGKFSFRGITAVSPGGLVHQAGVQIKIWTVVESKEIRPF